jgi:putative thioredoxin
MAFDVDEAQFEQRVIERSRALPVVVDFWAEWCGPCRTLSPALEAAAAKREGEVELAKVDTDRNQQLSAAFGIQGIPAVKAFRDAKVVSEFTGAIPPAQVERFFDAIVPSPADKLVESGDEEALRKALELDPRHVGAAQRLGRLLLERGDAAEALQMLDSFHGDFLAEGLAARARLASADGDGAAPDADQLESAFAAWDTGDHEAALEGLQAAMATAEDADRRDEIRKVMVAVFTELGADHPLAREHRRRLAAALN